MLDDLQRLGITSVRVPIGYWMFDTPVGGTSMRLWLPDQGFATGGVNALEALLPKLQARNMTLMLDLHALGMRRALHRIRWRPLRRRLRFLQRRKAKPTNHTLLQWRCLHVVAR